MHMQIYTHSVIIHDIRDHVDYRSTRSGTKYVFETGNINKKQLKENVKNKLTNHI